MALGYATANKTAGLGGTFILNFNGPDPRAYFPSTYSYVLAQTTGWSPTKGAALGQFLCFDVGQGQSVAAQLGYAPLSAAVVAISVSAITQIPGAPTAAQCTAGAPAPPPAPVIVPQSGTGSSGSKGGATPTGKASGTTGTTVAGSTVVTDANGNVVAVLPPSGSCTTTANGSCADNAAAVIAGTPSSATTIQSVPGPGGGPSNEQVLSSLLEGAALCAVGLAVVGSRKGAGKS